MSVRTVCILTKNNKFDFDIHIRWKRVSKSLVAVMYVKELIHGYVCVHVLTFRL